MIWRVVGDRLEPRFYAVQLGDRADMRFRVWTSREHAQNFADRLNDKWAGSSATLPQPASVV